MLKKVLKDKRFILLVVSLSILALVGAGLIYWRKTTYDPQKYNDYVSEADMHYESMEYALALDKYLLAADVAPRELDAYKGIITVLGEKGRFDDADKILKEAENNLFAEQKAILFAILGQKYSERMDYQKAYEYYDKAFDLDSTQENADMALIFGIKSGNGEKASKYLNVASTDTEGRLVWEEYSEISDGESDLYDVVKTSQKFLNDGYPYLVQVLLEDRSEDITEYWEGKYFLGRAYFDLEKYNDAQSQFESAVNLGADDYALYWYMGRASVELGDKDDAYKFYNRAVNYADDDQVKPLVIEYSDLLIKDGRYVDAENLLNQFYDQNWAKVSLMKAYQAQEKEDLFLKESGAYDVGSEDDQDRIYEYYLMMVEFYLVSNEIDKASQTATMIGELDGHEAVAAYYEGLIEKSKEDLEKARTAFQRSIDLDLDNSITEDAEKELVNLTN